MSYGGGHGTVEASISHNAATAVAPGLTVDMGVVFSQPVAQIATNGAVAGGVIVLEGSLDGQTWYVIATSAALNTSDIVLTAPTGEVIPARYLRTNITTIVTGGTVTSKVGAGA